MSEFQEAGPGPGSSALKVPAVPAKSKQSAKLQEQLVTNDPLRTYKVFLSGGKGWQSWCAPSLQGFSFAETARAQACHSKGLTDVINFLPAALSGAISRTATAPVDRLKMLLQTHDGAKGLSLRQGWQKMMAEGACDWGGRKRSTTGGIADVGPAPVTPGFE